MVMKAKMVGQLTAGFLSSVLIGQNVQAQMQAGGGSTIQTPTVRSSGGNTGGSFGGGNTGGSFGGGSGSGNSTPLGGSDGPGGLSLQSMDFNQGGTGGVGGNAAGPTTGGGRNSRRTTARNTGSPMGGMTGLQGMNLG